MEDKSFNFNVLWLDDDPMVFEKTVPVLEIAVSAKYQNKPNFNTFDDIVEFSDYFELHKDQVDFIFLDIDLGSSHNGVQIYKNIRVSNKNIIIVFVSGNLNDPKWEEKIEELNVNDSNLFTLPLPFPILGDEQFDEEILSPIGKMMKRSLDNKSIKIDTEKELTNTKNIIKDSIQKNVQLIQEIQREELFHISIDEFRNFTKPIGLYSKANELHKDIAKKKFREVEGAQFIIMDEPKNIINIGLNGQPLTPAIITEFCMLYDKFLLGYNRKNGNDVDLVEVDIEKLKSTPKSTDLIPSQILEVQEDHVLLNCLLDPEARQFQIRRFDLEPIEDAVTLKKNQLIIVEIKTYVGKRVFSFKDNKDAKWEPYFERKKYFDGSKDYSAFLNPKASKK